MSEPVILFVKPKAISVKDKKALGTAGVIVVEVDDPQAVKLTRAAAEISTTDMLAMAAKAIKSSGSTHLQSQFADLICEALMHPLSRAHPNGSPQAVCEQDKSQ